MKADNLLARFCYALTAELEGERDAQGSGSGRLINPICVEREFSFSEESDVPPGVVPLPMLDHEPWAVQEVEAF